MPQNTRPTAVDPARVVERQRATIKAAQHHMTRPRPPGPRLEAEPVRQEPPQGVAIRRKGR